MHESRRGHRGVSCRSTAPVAADAGAPDPEVRRVTRSGV